MSESRTENLPTEILKTDVRGRVRVSKARREAILDEFERSGMTGQAFAGSIGVKYPTFAHWRQKRRLDRQGRSGAEMSAKEVKWLEAVVEGSGRLEVGGVAVVIHLSGGMRVECAQVGTAVEFVRAMGGAGC